MVSASLKKGERVALPGLGVFSVVQKKARTGRNPGTGAAIKIPARKAVKFAVSSVLKQGSLLIFCSPFLVIHGSYYQSFAPVVL